MDYSGSQVQTASAVLCCSAGLRLQLLVCSVPPFPGRFYRLSRPFSASRVYVSTLKGSDSGSWTQARRFEWILKAFTSCLGRESSPKWLFSWERSAAQWMNQRLWEFTSIFSDWTIRIGSELVPNGRLLSFQTEWKQRGLTWFLSSTTSRECLFNKWPHHFLLQCLWTWQQNRLFCFKLEIFIRNLVYNMEKIQETTSHGAALVLKGQSALNLDQVWTWTSSEPGPALNLDQHHMKTLSTHPFSPDKDPDVVTLTIRILLFCIFNSLLLLQSE